MISLLTFDVEEWFQANYPSIRRRRTSHLDSIVSSSGNDERLESNLTRILDLCHRHQARATFFILGQTAERYPSVVLRILKADHEIASHGYEHALIYERTRDWFRSDLRKSLAILEGLTGQKILGYRAPSWSVFQHLNWFFEELKNHGLVYDSSLFPARTFLYGERDAPRFPQAIQGLVEIPASTFSWAGLRIPFSSGFFFRIFPLVFIRVGMRALQRKGQPAMVCLHPREIDPSMPKPPWATWRDRFIHSVGRRRTARKLEALLKEFSFVSIRDYLSC